MMVYFNLCFKMLLSKIIFFMFLTSSISSSPAPEVVITEPVEDIETKEELQILDNGTLTSGIFFRISQKGVDYITSLAEEGIPKILDRFALPNVDTDNAKINDLIITQFDKPSIKSQFINNYGVGANLSLPLVAIHGEITVDLFFVSYKGSFKLELKNLEIETMVGIKRELYSNETIVNVSKCEIAKNFADIIFYGDDVKNLMGIKDIIIKNVEEKVTNTVCGLAYMIKGFLDEQANKVGVKQEEVMEENNNIDNESFHDSLCSSTDFDYEENENIVNDSGDDESFNGTNGFKLSNFGMDISLRYPPTFSDKDVVFGIDGGILYLNIASSNVSRPDNLNISILKDQMVGFIITDYVPNTFFEHIHNNGFGVIEEEINYRNAPKFMRKIIETVCKTCKIVISANLTEKPVTEISKRGILLKLSGKFGIFFSRNNVTKDILSSDISFEITIRPHIRHSRIFGELSLTAVEVNINSIGMNGILANGLRKVLNLLIPKAIWPTLKKRLRIAINKRGIKLPVICGVELEKLHVDHQDHATVLSSDFSFDLPHFLKSFKKYMDNRVQSKIKRNERYDDIARYY